MTLRRQPSDFLVEERLSSGVAEQMRATSTGRFAIYALRKTSLTTPDAVNRLARELGIRPDTVGYAGLKDKHAETVQYVSVPVNPKRPTPEQVTPTARSEAAPDTRWSAALAGTLDHELSSKDIDGNRFVIVVRDLARETCDEMVRRARLLGVESPDGSKALRIVNYFGAQRFGSARHGEGWIARALIAGDFELALKLAIGTPARKDSGQLRTLTRLCAQHWGKWERIAKDAPRIPEAKPLAVLARGGENPNFKQAFAALPAFLQALYLEAYQSHLWNRIAHEMVQSHSPSLGGGKAESTSESPDAGPVGSKSKHGDKAARTGRSAPTPVLKSDDEFGEMLFPEASAVPGWWLELDVPLLSKKSVPVPPWGDAAERVLQREEITLADLRVPGLDRPFFGEAPRRFAVDATNASISPREADDLTPKRFKCEVRFELPRGSYATVVLRALGQ
ncbi:MAG: tRNA pseudouridine(13) synthase TruD [Phycisphaerales bacterium]|nr:tRNA pseudouridine(13) synthase TruD [Phycisphaerales bacterium]